jgi:Flp pilus assembly protein TadD
MFHAPGGWKRERRHSITRFAVVVLLVLDLGRSTASAQERPFDSRLAHAYATAYSLDHDEAVRELTALARLSPDLPDTYRALASITWLRLLFSRGTVLADEYLGRIARHDVQMAAVQDDIASDFRTYLSKAITLAESRLLLVPRDGRAHYDLSSALGLQASWAATVEGRMARAFGAARRAYKTAQQAASLSPDDPDPRLVLGTYRYVVSGLNLPSRMVAYLSGMDGDRNRGLRLVEQAAGSASPVRTEARFALVLLYNRERRWDDALAVLTQLRSDYPRNRLLWLETGATALRAGRTEEALRWLSAGIDMTGRDPRRRMFGEQALWRLKRAQALGRLGRITEAREDLLEGLAAPEARDWVRGRLHLEFGELALASGDRDQARWQAAKALPLLERGSDPEGVTLARRLLERAGRG